MVLGYLNNDKANKETFQDGWMRTGDEAVIKKGPSGNEHVFIVDRIKELIKVKVRYSQRGKDGDVGDETRLTRNHCRATKSPRLNWRRTSSRTLP